MGVRLGTPYFLPGLLTGLGVGNFFLGVAQTQIAFDDARIVAKLFGFAFQDDFAGFQNVAVVGHLQGGAGVLFDQQYGNAGAAQTGDDLEYFTDNTRRQAHAGFVKTEQMRRGPSWPASGPHLALPPKPRAAP